MRTWYSSQVRLTHRGFTSWKGQHHMQYATALFPVWIIKDSKTYRPDKNQSRKRKLTYSNCKRCCQQNLVRIQDEFLMVSTKGLEDCLFCVRCLWHTFRGEFPYWTNSALEISLIFLDKFVSYKDSLSNCGVAVSWVKGSCGAQNNILKLGYES